MTIEIHTSGSAFDSVTKVQGTFESVTADLNLAAAANKHFIALREEDGSPVAIQVQTITKIRDPKDDADAFFSN